MTLRTYTVHPDGSRTEHGLQEVHAHEPFDLLASPVTYPPCACPRHRAPGPARQV